MSTLRRELPTARRGSARTPVSTPNSETGHDLPEGRCATGPDGRKIESAGRAVPRTIASGTELVAQWSSRLHNMWEDAGSNPAGSVPSDGVCRAGPRASYRTWCFRRQMPGAMPCSRLNALAKANSAMHMVARNDVRLGRCVLCTVGTAGCHGGDERPARSRWRDSGPCRRHQRRCAQRALGRTG